MMTKNADIITFAIQDILFIVLFSFHWQVFVWKKPLRRHGKDGCGRLRKIKALLSLPGLYRSD